jgi:hypothetical protein
VCSSRDAGGTVIDVAGLKTFVRNHLEMDEEELPDTLLNVYFADAFDRTMAFDNSWPRFETTWNIAKTPGGPAAMLPPDCNIPSLVSVVSMTNGYSLAVINHENAEQAFMMANTTVPTGTPLYCSIWDRQLWLWPPPALDASYDIQLRGYPQPVWSDNASDIPDLDSRLHPCLAYYVIALSYAQQEDEVLEGVYMGRWQRDLQQQMKTMLAPVRNRPLIMNGGNPVGGTSTFIINPPVDA